MLALCCGFGLLCMVRCAFRVRDSLEWFSEGRERIEDFGLLWIIGRLKGARTRGKFSSIYRFIVHIHIIFVWLVSYLCISVYMSLL